MAPCAQAALVGLVLLTAALGQGCAFVETPELKPVVRVQPWTEEYEDYDEDVGSGFLRPIVAVSFDRGPADEICPCSKYADPEVWRAREERVRRYRMERGY